MTFEDITAAPALLTEGTSDGEKINLNGQISLADNAFCEGEFQIFASDISLGEHLACALPEGIRSIYQALSPTGRFDLELEKVKISKTGEGQKYVDFEGLVKLKGCNFDMSGTQAQLDAVMKVKALYKIKSGFTNGQVNLIADNLKIKGKSIRNMRADFTYSPHFRSWEACDLIADCYGGRVSGKLEFKQPPFLSSTEDTGGALEYLLQVGFGNIDLRRFLQGQDSTETSQTGYSSGTMDGSLSLGARIAPGKSESFPSRLGRCRLAIRDMQVGKLSPLAKLLYVLELKEQKDFAFQRMVVDSYLKQNKLFFEKFDLEGSAVAFSGTGWMDMQSENVDLTLTARGERLAAAEPSFMQSLAEGLGSAVVRMEVSGSVYDPKVETKTLPLVGDSLKILGRSR
jgi:hypothetical protein